MKLILEDLKLCFGHLFPDLVNGPEKFVYLSRMTTEQFKILVELIKPSIRKEHTNYRCAVGAEEIIPSMKQLWHPDLRSQRSYIRRLFHTKFIRSSDNMMLTPWRTGRD